MIEQKNLVILSGVVIKPPEENVKFGGYWCKILTGKKSSIVPVFIPNDLFESPQQKNYFAVGSHIEVACIVKALASGNPFIFAVDGIQRKDDNAKRFNNVTLEGYALGPTRFSTQEVVKHDRVVFAQQIATRQMEHVNKSMESTFIDIRSNNVKQISEINTGEEITVDGEIRFNKHECNGMFIWPNKIKR